MKDAGDILRRVVRNTFWDAYDHLGLLLVTNLLWLLFAIPILTLPLATAGMLRVTYEMATSRDARIRDFFTGALALAKPTTALVVAMLLSAALAAGNILFYLGLVPAAPFLGVLLACVCLWLALVVAAAMQFALPAAAELWTAHDPEHVARAAMPTQDRVIYHERLGLPNVTRRVPSALKVGLVLLLQAPTAAGMCLLNLVVFWALCLVTGAGLALLSAGVSLLACHHLYAETIAQITGLGDRRAHEQRNLRDLLPPWDSAKRGAS